MVLLGGLIVSLSTYASQLDQIKQNAQFVTVRFGPTSGVVPFGCNVETIVYLDSFISRQINTIKKDAQSTERFISLFGSFFGRVHRLHFQRNLGGNGQGHSHRGQRKRKTQFRAALPEGR